MTPRLVSLPTRCPNSSSGFSLVELLVATSITLILGIVLLGAAQGLMDSYTSTQSGILREADLAVALDQITADLEGLVLPNKAGAEALRLGPDPLTVGTLPDPRWLTFLATVLDSDNSFPGNANLDFDGATRAVSYRLAYQNTIPDSRRTEPSYGLYRSVATALHTFNHALNAANLQSDYWQAPPPSPSPAPVAPTAVSGLFTENIVNFSVRFQYDDANGNEIWTDPSDMITISRGSSTRNGNSIDGTFRRAEVSVTAVSPEGAKRLLDGMPLAEVVKRYGKTSVRQTAFLGK